MREARPTPAHSAGAFPGSAPSRPGGPGRRAHTLTHLYAPLPQAQIQITPLLDVLLVLLVMGLLAWSASQGSGQTRAKTAPPADPWLGLTLPFLGSVDASTPLTPAEDRLRIGLGVQDRLSWGDAPVTRDILTRQLQEALARNRHAEVWLAVDPAVPTADLLPWLAWLQTQQVTRLTLLHRAQRPAAGTGKP